MGNEKEYYPCVQERLKKCGYYTGGYLTTSEGEPFTHFDKGKQKARVDVLGIKNLDTPLSDEIEVAAVEVKDVKKVALKDIIQASGYSLFAHRCYLANTEKFTKENRRDAERFGTGLLRIDKKAKKAKAILSARLMNPDRWRMLEYLEKYFIVQCAICKCYIFESKEPHAIAIKEFTLEKKSKDMTDEKAKELEKKGYIKINWTNTFCRLRRSKIFSALASNKSPEKAKKIRRYRTDRYICNDCYNEFLKRDKHAFHQTNSN